MIRMLTVDETTQGYRKEYEDVSVLREDVNALIDEDVVEIKVTKRAIPKNGPSCENVKDSL